MRLATQSCNTDTDVFIARMLLSLNHQGPVRDSQMCVGWTCGKVAVTPPRADPECIIQLFAHVSNSVNPQRLSLAVVVAAA